MSGVRVGSRLEQLLHLRRQLDHEIAQERARQAANGQHRAASTPAKPRRERADRTRDLLAQLGVTTRTVREWAIEEGLLQTITRGRIRHELVEAYAHAHREDTAR